MYATSNCFKLWLFVCFPKRTEVDALGNFTSLWKQDSSPAPTFNQDRPVQGSASPRKPTMAWGKGVGGGGR